MKFNIHTRGKPRGFVKHKTGGGIRGSYFGNHVSQWFTRYVKPSFSSSREDTIFKDLRTSRRRFSSTAVCIEKYTLDWKVDNLELLKLQGAYEEDPVVAVQVASGSDEDDSASMYIYSAPFVTGNHINRDSEWTLAFKSHHAIQGSYNYAVILFLNRIFLTDNGNLSKMGNVSFSIHALDEHGEVILSRHMQDVSFEPTPQNDESKGYGFYDFIPFHAIYNGDVCGKRLFSRSTTALHLRLDLFLSASRPTKVEVATPIRISPQPIPSRSQVVSMFRTDDHIAGHSSKCVEIVADKRSFHVDPRHFHRFPRLKALLKEDEEAGNLGIITALQGVSDVATQALLRYVVGNYVLLNCNNLEETLEILQLAHRFKIPELAHDMWLKFVQFTNNLDNFPIVAAAVTRLKGPKFVMNHIRLLLHTFIFDLRNRASFREWATSRPLSFLSLFFGVPDLEDGRRTSYYEETDGNRNHLLHGDTRGPSTGWFFMKNNDNKICYQNDKGAEQCGTSQGKSSEETCRVHDDNCKCETCRVARGRCEECLYSDYTAKVMAN